MLTRFYDIDGGVITLDGQDIWNIPVNKLRGSIGIVLQDTVIFSDTIAQNIRYGRIDATDEEIVEAAKIARVDDFASKLSDGYNTMLTEGGSQPLPGAAAAYFGCPRSACRTRRYLYLTRRHPA